VNTWSVPKVSEFSSYRRY